MANVPQKQQINPEDFKKDEQESISKVAEPFNTYVDQLNEILNNNLTFSDNIRGELKTVQVVGGQAYTFRYGRSDKPVGLWIVSYTNVTNPSEVLSTAVQAQWSYDGKGNITISNVTSLTASNKYNLTIIVISG